MLNMELARKYARAIFALACEDHALKEYGADLGKVQQLYHDCPELKAYLCNPNIQPEDKKSLLKEVFEGGVRETVLNFLLLLIDKPGAYTHLTLPTIRLVHLSVCSASLDNK